MTAQTAKRRNEPAPALAADIYRRMAELAFAETERFTALVQAAELDPAEDFCGALLTGDMRGEDLSGFDFTGAEFRGCDLRGADLFWTAGVTEAMLNTAVTDAETRRPSGLLTAGCRKPSWMHQFGSDATGPWVSFLVPGTDVVQRMRWCPAGSFDMGSPDSDKVAGSDEKPRHRVTFAEGFWMFETVVTEALWTAVTGEWRLRLRSGRFPATRIDWNEASRFIRTLNGLLPGLDLSLPSEAAWEYACRAGTTTRYSFGNTITKQQVCFGGGNSVAVGSLPANDWGLHEMHGNVWEWCLDRYHKDYTGAPDDGSAWLDAGARGAADRVLRGGSWRDDARNVRAAFRNRLDPAFRGSVVGFRCARVRSDSGAAGAASPAHPPSERSAERREPDGGAGNADPAAVG
jgi:formylglycine-generating enzyme required for sulfatase activity